jgi:tRNA threonylcarbamoyladenosine biosynthesis protein TsaE
MSKPFHRSFRFSSPEATGAFAARLAPALIAGDVVLLQGDLGAGKTHFARAVIQTRLTMLGLTEDVPSPTFTLVQTYDAGDVEIWHTDLYRLSSVDEVFELGLDDAFDTAVCLVEWPDRLGEETPEGALVLHFTMTDKPEERLLQASSGDPRWRNILDHANG